MLNIVELLRNPNGGCPWDIEQTHESIKMNMLEEAYEAVDAIEQQSSEHLCEELGDLLLQIALHTQMAKESGQFTFDAVCDGICKKLIYRHPHVFGDTAAKTAADVLQNWETLKREEKGREDIKSDIADVPRNFPALMYAQKVQKRASNHGFNYGNAQAAMDDLKSEIVELEQAIENNDTENTLEELGDLIFSAVNLSRMLKQDAEAALSQSTQKFIGRVLRFSELAKPLGDIKMLSKQQMDELWEQSKFGFTVT